MFAKICLFNNQLLPWPCYCNNLRYFYLLTTLFLILNNKDMGNTLYFVSMHLSWNLKSNSCQLTELRSVFLVFASFHGEVCPVCSVPEAAPSHHLATTRALREDRALWLSHFKIKSSSQTNPRPSEGVVNKTVESYSFYTCTYVMCQLSSRRETFLYGFSMSYFLFDEPPFIPDLHCTSRILGSGS